MKFISACLMAVLIAPAAHATDRFFPDIHVHCPSGRFRLDATSPDNKSKEYTPFQARFTYKCVDTQIGKVNWTRNQPMRKPQRLSEDSDFELTLPAEASPVAIYVSDTGFTVIRTAGDDLILVSPAGKDVGTIDLLDDALTDAENEQYVHHTTAGPSWTGLSAWYYLRIPAGEFFVVRPWWGRRIFVDTRRAALAHGDKTFIDAAAETEGQLVLDALTSDNDNSVYGMSKYNAAYLAGVLKLQRAVLLLKTLESSTDCGSCTSGGLSFGVHFENEVAPHSYSTFSLRQVAQLSLRRLGVSPRPLPCHSFDLLQQGKSQPFEGRAREVARHETVKNVEVGMSAKQVLDLIGAPDFISYDGWSYDMDATTPFSVTLTFDARKVTQIKRDEPLWKSGQSRDQSLAY